MKENILSLLSFLLWMTSAGTAAPIAKRMVEMTHDFGETTLSLGFQLARRFQMTVVINGTWGTNDTWMQAEEYTSGTHIGTHMDAPSHFSKGAISVDQIPISRLIAPAAVIDITEKAELSPEAEATVEDLEEWERTTGQSLNGTIVLIRSGWGRYWNNLTAYAGTSESDITKLHFPGLSGDSAHWLVANRNIYGVGVETFSFDRGSSREYTCHKVLLAHGIYGLENVANIDKIPIYGATLYVMPMKMENASGAPTRIIATYPEVIFSPPTEN